MSETDQLLEKLDSVAPIHKFDAFPKVERTYTSRSAGGGLWTVLVLLLSVLLVLNDLSEYIWGWPDYEFDVDSKLGLTMVVNVDMVVNMPCHFLSVDLRDVVGDRLHLSEAFKREGTIFDLKQAKRLQDWQAKRTELAARDAVALSRKSRGFFAWMRSSSTKRGFAPTYNHRLDGSACRVYGSVEVKKVTANLHVTTLGHGYGGFEHTEHSKMNLSHIITEFSFGPYIPDIVQPLDYSSEITTHPFSVFQYFLTVVPTTYHASASRKVETNQYSVTHYVKHVEHGQAAPGLFFKFDIDPMAVAVHQRTTTFVDFFTRVIAVVGGVWVCARWAFKIGGKAVEKVVGPMDDDENLVRNAQSSARKSRWTGGSLNKRARRPSGWDDATVGAVPSPTYGWNSPTPGSPYSYGANTPGSSYSPSPYAASNTLSPPSPYSLPSGGPGHVPRRSISGNNYAAGVPLPASPVPSRTPPLGTPPSPAAAQNRPTSGLNPNRLSIGSPGQVGSRPPTYEKKND